jgi:hypothetical protein
MREGLSTVIKLSRQMSDTVVFARMNGDEIDSCMQFLKDMDVVEVHTLLFIRDGKICETMWVLAKENLLEKSLDTKEFVLPTRVQSKYFDRIFYHLYEINRCQDSNWVERFRRENTCRQIK